MFSLIGNIYNYAFGETVIDEPLPLVVENQEKVNFKQVIEQIHQTEEKILMENEDKVNFTRDEELENIIFSIPDLINPTLKYNRKKNIREQKNSNHKYGTVKSRKMNMHNHQWQNRRINRQTKSISDV